ncbi:hypothetical protein OLX02_13245 [Novosphingobium sp. KCTC 2891]|uniref:hypothetical protein n=1 Tax=Novosphingobium sp. KCTC 2891 TaxID=2989730 RepID=UPI0022221EBB|nr:hypothetical protein [Novosphingobium sp. KCTC 2891]MCW1383788.1 hypothetical protein [Novosphingobium sp. KCTC 2891]
MVVTVIFVDLLGLALIVLGTTLAFRQNAVLGWWAIRRQRRDPRGRTAPPGDGSPAQYALRIAGVMLLAFGLAISLLFTLFYLAT